MSQGENINIDNHYNEYNTKIKDIENIFTKVKKVLDISKYKEEVEKIKDEVYNKEINFDNISYNLYSDKLDNLINKIELELLPFYELYLLFSKINAQITNVFDEDFEDIIKNTKELIDNLNSLNNLRDYTNKSEKNLIDKVYRTIYTVIIYEKVFNKNDILSYINYLNVSTINENIGSLLLSDINNLREQDLANDDFQNIIIDEDLRNIDIEGLRYDYLNSHFIKKISEKILRNKYLEFEERKRKDILDISSKINTFSRKNNGLTTVLNQNNEYVKKLYTEKSLLLTKALSIILVPIITIGAGRIIGKTSSDKITEYKTITRTIDLNTRNIIGDIEYVYDENETTYVATVMECGPWKNNPLGIGYIRNITAYECIVPNYMDGKYNITADDLENNFLKKYNYIESKEVLDKEDNCEETTILLTETYQDKNDNRKSTKYIIPFSIVGAGIGIAIDVALVYFGIYDFQKIKRIFDELDSEIKKYKLSEQEINDKLAKLLEDGKKLNYEYENLIKKYGNFDIQPNVFYDDSFCKVNVKKRKINHYR